MKCRLWWPVRLQRAELTSSALLYGWFISRSSSSVDAVVAFSREESWFAVQSSLQETFSCANTRIPLTLQDKSTFSPIGQYNPSVSFPNGDVFAKIEDSDDTLNTEDFSGIRNWIILVRGSYEDCQGHIGWIPKLQRVRLNGLLHVACDVHVIFYETPLYGDLHYCMRLNYSISIMDGIKKKPKWLAKLHVQDSHFDVETVLCAINCSRAIEDSFSKEQIRCCKRFRSLGWELLAFGLASLSTVVYIILQCVHGFVMSFGDWFQLLTSRIFEMTSRVIQYYCCQIQYWPLFLQHICNRSTSCVEYAEKDSLRRHSMWATLAVDLLLGNVIGLALLYYAESSWSWVSNFTNDITDQLLRSGCVWLMGVPAGFKLNTELARALGMMSLNVIQTWSTIWVSMSCFFVYFIKGLAILGLIFGATILGSLTIDMINLSSIHVLALHWVFSFLYSYQTRAISSLWRLFRGRKRNPLRQRFDSYEYFVKQHVVGSLLFTPLLLLLPTTSVFYIFFTILKTSITVICVFNEIAISMIYSTPYVKIILWLTRRRRFPSGIWFEFISYKTEVPEEFSPLQSSQSGNLDLLKRSNVLVSILRSNFLSFGDLVRHHYIAPFSGLSSFIIASSYGALTGKRTSSTCGCHLPAILPWMSLPAREYWRLCYNSVLDCQKER